MQGSSSGGGSPGGGGSRPSYGVRYAKLQRVHQAGRDRKTRELAERAGRAATNPAQEPGGGPARISGNEWVARAKAAARQLQERLFGTYPALTPDGRATAVALPRPRQAEPSQLAAGPKRPDLAKPAAEKASVAAKAVAAKSIVAKSEPPKAIRAEVAALWEKPPGKAEVAKDTPQLRREAGAAVDAVYARIVAARAVETSGPAAARETGRSETLAAKREPKTSQEIKARALGATAKQVEKGPEVRTDDVSLDVG